MTAHFRVLILLALAVCYSLGKEISRGSPDDAEAVPASVVIPTKGLFKKEIRKQVNALKRMKCKPIFQKVSTYDHIPDYHEYHELDRYEIFPQVLAVKKCNESCSYCHPKNGEFAGQRRKQGMEEVMSCQVAKAEIKNYAIRAKDLETGKVSYFHIPLENDIGCECMPKRAKRHRHGHGSD